MCLLILFCIDHPFENNTSCSWAKLVLLLTMTSLHRTQTKKRIEGSKYAILPRISIYVRLRYSLFNSLELIIVNSNRFHKRDEEKRDNLLKDIIDLCRRSDTDAKPCLYSRFAREESETEHYKLPSRTQWQQGEKDSKQMGLSMSSYVEAEERERGEDTCAECLLAWESC